MFFAFFAMHLKWLCIVFALLSTLRLSEGQEFTSVDGRDYGIMYGSTTDTLVGSITGGATCGSTTSATDYVKYADTASITDDCFVLSVGKAYVGTDNTGAEAAGGVNSEAITPTPATFAVYVAPGAITDATATYETTAGPITTVTLPSLTAGDPTFYYDCGTALNAIDGGQEYFSFVPDTTTAGVAGTLSWKKALAEDPILFLGSIRCLFSHQAGNSANNYETASTNSHRVVVDFTIDPPFATDATITCSLNPTAADAGVGTVVGTYAYGGDTPLTGCTANPTGLLELQNAAKCYGVVTVAAGASLTAGSDVTLTVQDSTPTTGSCIMAVTAAVTVVAPTCSANISGVVDLQYWRASTTATANANVLVDKAIATSPGRALTYSIASSTMNDADYTFEQNTLQVTAAAAATKADGVYTIMVDAVDADDSSKTAACEVSLTVGPQNCVP